MFIRSGSTWAQNAILTASDQTVSDQFGWSVAIDANVAIIGAIRGDGAVTDSGVAYIFVPAP